jgi:hypothetical protein
MGNLGVGVSGEILVLFLKYMSIHGSELEQEMFVLSKFTK